MQLSPIVNTEEKMPKKMFDALSLHETFCVCSNIDQVTEESVKAYLSDKYGKQFADGFDPKFLLSTQAA